MIIKGIIALVFSVIGVGGSIYLKSIGFISEPSLVIFILASAVVGLFIYYSNKIKSINLQKGEIILQEMKETETNIKYLGKAVLEVVEASSHSIMLESFDEEAYEKAVNKLRKAVA